MNINKQLSHPRSAQFIPLFFPVWVSHWNASPKFHRHFSLVLCELRRNSNPGHQQIGLLAFAMSLGASPWLWLRVADRTAQPHRMAAGPHNT